MADLIINGTTFNASAAGNKRPTGLVMRENKIGVTLPAANGTRNRVERNVTKRIWEITWENTNLATMQAVRTIQRLMTTFSFSDLEGTSYTVQTESDDFAPEFAFTDSAGANYYNFTLTLYEQ